MIKIAFCDDDMEVLHQMNELLDRYRVCLLYTSDAADD